MGRFDACCVQLFNSIDDEEEEIEAPIASNVEEIKEWQLNKGEYTDGLTIVRCPEGFQCERKNLFFDDQETEPQPYLYLDAGSSNITLATYIDNDMSNKNFVYYWNNVRDEDSTSYTEEIIYDGLKTVNGNPYHYRLTRYTDDESQIAWRFVLLYDIDANKVAVVSAYDLYPEEEFGDDSYLEEFLSNIRFR